MKRTILAAILALTTYAALLPTTSAGGMNLSGIEGLRQTPLVVSSRPVIERTITVVATSYCLPGTTAIGTRVAPGTIAVDPSVIPLGSHLYVSGYGFGTALDTGSAIVGNRVDVWLPPAHGCTASWNFGRRTETVEVLATQAFVNDQPTATVVS